MKKNVIKIILILATIGLLAGFGVYIYVFHKPHRDVTGEKAMYTLAATELLKQFSEKEDSTFKLYGDKAIQVAGKIADITKKGGDITLVLVDATTGINCYFTAEYCNANKLRLETLKPGDDVTIKGKCDGFDAIMGVTLTQCVVNE